MWILLPTFWGWIIRLVPLQTMSGDHLELITFRCGRSHVWWRRLTQVSVAQQMICWRIKLHQIRNIDVKRIEHPTTHCYQNLLIILRLHPQVDINILNSVTSKQNKKGRWCSKACLCELQYCGWKSPLPYNKSTCIVQSTFFITLLHFHQCKMSHLTSKELFWLYGQSFRPYTGAFIQECHRFGTFRITYKLGQPARNTAGIRNTACWTGWKVLHPLSKITSYMFVCYKPTNELLSLSTFWLSREINR